MDFFVQGSGNAINVFIILTIIFVFMFVREKITFKQLVLISLALIIITMIYIKHENSAPFNNQTHQIQPNAQQLLNDINKISQLPAKSSN